MSQSLADIIAQCLESKQGYDKNAESVSAYVGDVTKNIKLQQPVVNVVKQTIKSKTHSSLQKLLALRLLNKCFQKRNKEFNKYVDKKIMARLVIFAQHNKQKNQESEMTQKGEYLFSDKETDKQSAAAFFVLLLECIEQWSKIFPLSDDNKTPSNFVKNYVSLQQKKILFPSQCRGNPLANLGLVEESRLSRPHNNNANLQSQNSQRGKSEYKKSSSSGQQLQKQIDTKKLAEDLKAKMQKAKSVSKKSETFLSQLEQNNFQSDPSELMMMEEQLNQGKQAAEFSIDQLMSDDIKPIISNAEQLLSQMLSYQEQILTAIAIIQPISDNLKMQEKKAYEQFSTNKQKQQSSQGGRKNTLAPQSKNNFATSVPKQEQNQDENDLWSQLDQFATNTVQSNPQNQNQFGQFGNFNQQQQQQQQVEDDDPFADAVREMQRIKQGGAQIQQQQQQPIQSPDKKPSQDSSKKIKVQEPKKQVKAPPVKQPSSNQNSQQKVQDSAPQADPNDFFSRYQVMDKPEEVQQQQQQDYNFGYDQNQNAYGQSPQKSFGRQDSDRELDVIVNQPSPSLQQQEEEKQSMGGGLSLFRLAQEGITDFEQDNRNNRNQDQQYQQNQNQSNYNTSYQGGNNQGFSNSQEPVSYQDRFLQAVGAESQSNVGGGSESNQVSELKKKVEQLKRENMSLLTSNQSLKDRYENLKNEQAYNQPANDDLYMQNQQIETSMNNMRDYYERELEQKEYALRTKDNEIQSLLAEVNQLRAQLGQPPKESQNSQQSPDQQQQNYHGASYNDHAYQNNDQNYNQDQAQIRSRADTPPIEDHIEYSVSVKSNYDPKLDAMYFKSIFADKFLLYEDEVLKIGCIRSVSAEWRLITLKLFLGNKSQTNMVEGVQFKNDVQHVRIKDEENFPQSIRPGDQLEVVIYVGAQVHLVPFINFTYQTQGQPSTWKKMKLAASPLYFCETFNINAQQFKSFWSFTKYPKTAKFDLDMKRASNLQQIKKILTMNEKHGLFVTGVVDGKQNVVGVSANHLEGYVFIMLEISPSGTGCVLQVKTEVTDEFSQRILDILLDLIAVKQD
eukprot:403339056